MNDWILHLPAAAVIVMLVGAPLAVLVAELRDVHRPIFPAGDEPHRFGGGR